MSLKFFATLTLWVGGMGEWVMDWREALHSLSLLCVLKLLAAALNCVWRQKKMVKEGNKKLNGNGGFLQVHFTFVTRFSVYPAMFCCYKKT